MSDGTITRKQLAEALGLQLNTIVLMISSCGLEPVRYARGAAGRAVGLYDKRATLYALREDALRRMARHKKLARKFEQAAKRADAEQSIGGERRAQVENARSAAGHI